MSSVLLTFFPGLLWKVAMELRDKTTPQWRVLNVLGTAYDTNPDRQYTVRQLSDILQSVDLNEIQDIINDYLAAGIVDSDVIYSSDPKYRGSNGMVEVHQLTPKGFEYYLQHDTASEEDPGARLKVENHEEVADELDALAEALKAKNEYVGEHKTEAEYTIQSCEHCAKSLRDNDGTTLWQRVKDLLPLLERVLHFFDRTSHIGERALKIIGYFQ